MAKWVYKFQEGNASMRNLLGGKGCNLAEMTGLGMPIPQGFTVTTEACTEYYNCGKKISDEIQTQIFDALKMVRRVSTARSLAIREDPLLVSVRSGARASMPGMMDTILNLGSERCMLLKASQRRPAIQDLHMILTEDLSRCSPTLLWRFRRAHFEKIIDEIKEAKGVKLRYRADR